MIETIQGNIEGKGFSRREILDAKLARETQCLIGHPPSAEFKQIVSRNPKTFPFSAVDVHNSQPIFGLSRPRLRGAATRQRPKVVREERLDISRDFYNFHKRVTLHMRGRDVCQWLTIFGYFLTEYQICDS